MAKAIASSAIGDELKAWLNTHGLNTSKIANTIKRVRSKNKHHNVIDLANAVIAQGNTGEFYQFWLLFWRNLNTTNQYVLAAELDYLLPITKTGLLRLGASNPFGKSNQQAEVLFATSLAIYIGAVSDPRGAGRVLFPYSALAFPWFFDFTLHYEQYLGICTVLIAVHFAITEYRSRQK